MGGIGKPGKTLGPEESYLKDAAGLSAADVTTIRMLLRISQERYIDPIRRVALHPLMPERRISELAYHDNKDVRLTALMSGKTQTADRVHFSNDSELSVLIMTALMDDNPSTHEKFAKHERPEVRFAVTKNPALGNGLLEGLMNDEVRTVADSARSECERRQKEKDRMD